MDAILLWVCSATGRIVPETDSLVMADWWRGVARLSLAAFSEEPSERPSTDAEFVASFQDAIPNRRVTNEPAPSVVAVPLVSNEPEDRSSAPRAGHEARRTVTRTRTARARARACEPRGSTGADRRCHVARRSHTRAFLVAAVVAVSFAAGSRAARLTGVETDSK